MRQRSLLRARPALALLLAALLVPAALAKGPPDKLTISGPGLDGEVEVTDRELLAEIGFGALEDFNENQRSGIAEPSVGEGYTLVRALRNPNGTYQPWDQAHYYPNPGGRGYIFYDGLVGPNTSEFDGKWYHARPEGEAAMQRLLQTLGAESPADQALPATGMERAPRGWLIGLAGALLLAGALARRGRRSPAWR